MKQFNPFNRPTIVGKYLAILGFILSILIIVGCLIGWFLTPFYVGIQSCCLIKVILGYLVVWFIGIWVWCWPLFLGYGLPFFSEYLETHYGWFPEPKYCDGCYGECGEYCDQ